MTPSHGRSPSRSISTRRRPCNASGTLLPGATAIASGSASPTMWASSLEPDLGLIGIAGTPATSAPMTATAVSIRGSASTATRAAPSSSPATARTARASST